MRACHLRHRKVSVVRILTGVRIKRAKLEKKIYELFVRTNKTVRMVRSKRVSVERGSTDHFIYRYFFLHGQPYRTSRLSRISLLLSHQCKVITVYDLNF